MTTHRALQISELHYTAEIGAASARRNADKLAGIGNANGARYLIQRAHKFDSIRRMCDLRLGRRP